MRKELYESLDAQLTNQHRFLVLSDASTVMASGNGQSRHPTAVLGHSRQSLCTHELVPFFLVYILIGSNVNAV